MSEEEEEDGDGEEIQPVFSPWPAAAAPRLFFSSPTGALGNKLDSRRCDVFLEQRAVKFRGGSIVGQAVPSPGTEWIARKHRVGRRGDWSSGEDSQAGAETSALLSLSMGGDFCFFGRRSGWRERLRSCRGGSREPAAGRRRCFGAGATWNPFSSARTKMRGGSSVGQAWSSAGEDVWRLFCGSSIELRAEMCGGPIGGQARSSTGFRLLGHEMEMGRGRACPFCCLRKAWGPSGSSASTGFRGGWLVL